MTLYAPEADARDRADRGQPSRPSDRVYVGYFGSWFGPVKVRERGNERDLRHHVLHSPDGFAWGYGGSGPAELARCILIDFFYGDDPGGGDLPLPVTYQDFKADVIAELPRGPWEMPAAQVQKWIKENER